MVRNSYHTVAKKGVILDGCYGTEKRKRNGRKRVIKTAKEVKWIQLSLDVFDNRKIRALEKMPDGDTLIVIWFKLLILAGIINDDGLVYFARDIPFTDQLLATQFDRPIASIQLALQTFQRFGMITVVDDLILVSNWAKYQNERWLAEARKEKDRERQKRWYDRQKKLGLPVPNVSLTLGETLDQREPNANVLSLPLNTSNDSQSLDKEDDEDGIVKGSGGKEKKPKKERKVFVKPTVDEIAAYCRERNNKIDPDAFFDKYESNGWVDKNGNAMKDWKATVRIWERYEKTKATKPTKVVQAQQYTQRDYTEDDLTPDWVKELSSGKNGE